MTMNQVCNLMHKINLEVNSIIVPNYLNHKLKIDVVMLKIYLNTLEKLEELTSSIHKSLLS